MKEKEEVAKPPAVEMDCVCKRCEWRGKETTFAFPGKQSYRCPKCHTFEVEFKMPKVKTPEEMAAARTLALGDWVHNELANGLQALVPTTRPRPINPAVERLRQQDLDRAHRRIRQRVAREGVDGGDLLEPLHPMVADGERWPPPQGEPRRVPHPLDEDE